MKNGNYKVPTNMTVREYFNNKYLPFYAIPKWKHRTYDTNMYYWNSDILSYFGDKRISKITPSDIERFLLLMRNKKVRNMKNTPEDDRPYLSETTIRYVYTLVHCFFKKAVQWDDIDKSPVKSDKPSIRKTHRDFLQPEQIEKVLDEIEDDLLHLAIHIAFRCTLRIGEVCALSWENINFEAKSISIEKTLERVSLDSLQKISPNDVFHVFPPTQKNSKSRLILTTPKTDFGIRSNTMSDQLCTELEQRKRDRIKDKKRYGEQYEDHNLVFCYPNGCPIDPRRLSDKFKKWQMNNSIEDVDSVVFHSIRITSTSLKLAVSGGDIKSAQKDLGDKITHMVLSTYARSLDTQHTAMNRKFDEFFMGIKIAM